MLFSKALAEGVQIGGFVDEPSMVLVTWKALTGEAHTSSFDAGGVFLKDLIIKGDVTDIIAVPLFKTKRTLYVSRLVKNADEIGDWFRAQGMDTVSAPGDMHVTIAYSKSEVDWEGLESENEDVVVPADLRRSVIPLGDAGAVVLKFENPTLQTRWAEFRKAGASWDYPAYQPHTTLTYRPGTDAGAFTPWTGPIVLGPEQFSEVTQDWRPTEKAEKVSKESVDYSKGMASTHCGNCGHFHPPGACEKVAGHIDPDMWCKLYVATAEKADRKSPPEGYPKDRSEYAVPDEYEFPIDGAHIHAAVSYFHSHRFKDEGQKRTAARRILAAAKRHGVEVSEDSDVSRAAHGD